jgi:hypothetical protein
MEVDPYEPPPLLHDLTFEITTGGYEIWFSDCIALDRPDLVDQSADWLEDQIGKVNLGQIDDKVLLANGVFTDQLKLGVVDRRTE